MTPATYGPRQRDSRVTAMIIVCGLHLLLYAAFRYAFTRTRAGNTPQTPGLMFLWTSPVPATLPARPVATPSRRPTGLTRLPERTPASDAEQKLPVRIDWASEATRSAAAIVASKVAGPGQATFGARPSDSPRRHTPSFQWDQTVTERIETIPGGGTLIKLNDHCGLSFAPLPMLGCWLGHREANGHLFDDMDSATRLGTP